MRKTVQWLDTMTFQGVRRICDLADFSGYVLWAIVVSNLRLAHLILQRNAQFDPGIIAIPLRATTTVELLILASVISLTPGTLSLDLRRKETGVYVLYVHTLNVGEPETFRRAIQQRFEVRLLRVTRGRASCADTAP